MNRRNFVASSVGLAALGSLSTATQVAAASGERQFLQLQKYTFDKDEQKAAFHAYMKDAAIPAMNRLGLKPIGVFIPDVELAGTSKDTAAYTSNIFVLIPHPTLESAVGLTQKLLADKEFTAKAPAFIDAPKDAPTYGEVENWLMQAFKGMPTVETPVKGPGRCFQLRIYESPSLQTGQKKIEMFNDVGELKLFRQKGLNPVFFGEVLFGAKMPNLTYMVGFENPDEGKAAWKNFASSPEWTEMKNKPDYKDARIIRKITNLFVKPAEYSQI